MNNKLTPEQEYVFLKIFCAALTGVEASNNGNIDLDVQGVVERAHKLAKESYKVLYE